MNMPQDILKKLLKTLALYARDSEKKFSSNEVAGDRLANIFIFSCPD